MKSILFILKTIILLPFYWVKWRRIHRACGKFNAERIKNGEPPVIF